MRKQCILLMIFGFILLTGSGISAAGEIETTLADQKGLFVTIYNQDMALVKDRRKLHLPQGEFVLAFKDVSGRIIPETALLSGSLAVIEQNFEFDLLTPESLLRKFTGETVSVIRTHPETGEETTHAATVLSTEGGVVLKMDDRIETGVPGRIVYPYIPENLRVRPTLTLTVESTTSESQDVELSYLTHGLTWKADYVARINASDDHLDLNGWVTLTNTSMTTFENADLQLVAGDVHLAPPPQRMYMVKAMDMAAGAAREDAFESETMFEYHLYTLKRRTTLKNNQTKQVSLLQAASVPCKKEYLIQGDSIAFRQSVGSAVQKMKTGVFLEIENKKANNLGIPLPKGVVRVYKQDSKGALQFAGEDSTDHIPENNTMRLKLGYAFDVTAEKKQTAFRKLPEGGERFQIEFEILVKNAKAETVMVKIRESIPGDWRMVRESHPHTKESSSYALWTIEVPAKEERLLNYAVRIR